MLRRSVGLVAAVVVLASASAGCGAAGRANPEKIGPRGVDELVIPTPDPDPDDFVDEVDNPWLPLLPGTVRTYDATGRVGPKVVIRVEERRETVAGVECTVVHSLVENPIAAASGTTRYYAQDRAGNVWLFGEQPDVETGGSRSWMAGEVGAQAGIAMLARPRVGDGYLQERAPSAQDRATVLSLDEETTVPAGTFTGLLVIEETFGGPDGYVFRRSYAEGLGLVEEVATANGPWRVALRSVVEPR